ncbi:hypothetical protein AB0C77_06530 [Streptomyces sp. NPDC048629]|uniref:hypothetical protein n=1 Tax=Streptomyces sp. NPDC048629 TaxID=3154824 RepID=UPI0034174C78
MIASPVSLVVDLADALRQQAVDAGSQTPSVRGADWHLATVTTVNADGTIVTSDGITARRAAGYEGPLVGEQIRISKSSTGNWLALGRLVSTSGDPWIAPTLTSPWADFGSGFQGTRYRLYANGDVGIEGVVGTGATSVSGTSALFTMPAGYRPVDTVMTAQVMNGNAVRQLTINNLGQVRFVNLPAGAVTFITLNTRFSTL